MSSQIPPPLLPAPFDASVPYGERLLPNLVDEIAANDPNRLLGIIANSPDMSKGFREFTFKEFARAVDTVAWWLAENVGTEEDSKDGSGIKKGKTIAYMGGSDFRYFIMMVASIKSGLQLLLPSLRNSLTYNLTLFDSSDCTVLCYTPNFETVAQGLAKQRPELCLLPVLEFEDMVKGDGLTPQRFPYNKTWEQARRDQVFIVHSSGSTGPPKPIPYSNEFLGTLDSQRKILSPNDKRPIGVSILEAASPPSSANGSSFFYLGFPFFHAAGICFGLTAIFYNVAIVLSGPGVIPTARCIVDIMRHVKLRVLLIPPSIAEDLAGECKDEYSRCCAGLELIHYGGGPLTQYAGDFFSKLGARVVPFIGMTETLSLPNLLQPPDEWQYYEWSSELGGIYMEPVGGDPNVCELVIKRKPDHAWMQSIFMAYPHIDQYRTKDLYRKHPTKELWTYEARLDDLIVLSNGEKHNPLETESLLQLQAPIRSALIFGASRTQLGLLLEPKDYTASLSTLVDAIWPILERANSAAPSHARIHRDMILSSSAAKPIPRAAKGTIMRAASMQLYKAEIDSLYNDDPSQQRSIGLAPDKKMPVLKLPLQTVTQFVQDAVDTLLGRTVSATDDLFALGMDSLQTNELAKSMRFGLKPFLPPAASGPIPVRLIYENPSVEKLSHAIFDMMYPEVIKVVNGDGGGVGGSDTNIERRGWVPSPSKIEEMKAIVRDYSLNLPARAPKSAVNGHCQNSDSNEGKINVVLTGSTGFLGHYILEALLADVQVGRVYCFNRGADGAKKFRADSCRSKISETSEEKRIEFLQVRYEEDAFGLSAAVYERLVEDVDIVIHNAWKVDFNHPLTSYTITHFPALRRFVTWSLRSPRRMKICFISSISAVHNWPTSSTISSSSSTSPSPPHQLSKPVPDIVIDDYRVVSHLGYGQSKYVAERILDVAAKERDVPVFIFRVGQIAGPSSSLVNGESQKNYVSWSKSDWVPSLLETSKALGLLPEALGGADVVDWIPVDELAGIVTDLSLRASLDPDKGAGADVFNLVNPSAVSYSRTLRDPIRDTLGRPQVCSLRDWLARLRNMEQGAPADLLRYPALKLLGHLESLDKAPHVPFETGNARSKSKKMSALKAVDVRDMQTWLKQWDF